MGKSQRGSRQAWRTGGTSILGFKECCFCYTFRVVSNPLFSEDHASSFLLGRKVAVIVIRVGLRIYGSMIANLCKVKKVLSSIFVLNCITNRYLDSWHTVIIPTNQVDFAIHGFLISRVNKNTQKNWRLWVSGNT